MYIQTRLFNHEVGHCLSLAHTIINGVIRDNMGNVIGVRCDYGADGACTDTPTRPEIEAYFPNFCDHCPFNQDTPDCPSNLMGYNAGHSITPCQAGTMHWTVFNEINEYRPCVYVRDIDYVDTFTENISYIAKTVEVQNTVGVLVDQGSGLYIQAEKFEIPAGSSFEIKSDCQFRANSVKACN